MTARLPRVFLALGPLDDGTARPDAEESHHLVRVLRARPGDAVLAFDGRGAEWEATVRDADRGSVTLTVGRATQRRSEAPVRVTLVQALVRGEKLDTILQKGTEIGVAAFLLVETRRAEAPEPSASRLARYRRVVLEACKQSGRLVIPELAVGPWPPNAADPILLDPSADAPPIGKLLAERRRTEASIVVGPEGGLTEEELGELERAGGRRCSLGPRVLRTETAGIVAGALILHVWGDLGSG